MSEKSQAQTPVQIVNEMNTCSMTDCSCTVNQLLAKMQARQLNHFAACLSLLRAYWRKHTNAAKSRHAKTSRLVTLYSSIGMGQVWHPFTKKPASYSIYEGTMGGVDGMASACDQPLPLPLAWW